ncbi:FkbM family methyltransferase [Methanoregula sp.]|uniref:FkbM family methyltransferase n=1 Tax=Methanoregula sp. TaxID=2052170 RepID=UPI002CBEB38D|nr:FkbM family methyltransferase [Methanoregula sp.]HVP97359.1 FkbM family methyltransferase [Methanoregula sp.]
MNNGSGQSGAGIILREGIRFAVRSTPYRQILDVPEYQTGDMGKNDRVLDIGANVGAFCLRAARISAHVTAVEPLTADLLEENIVLNDEAIRVIRGGLGTGQPAEIIWDECRMTVPTYTLRMLISLAGGCDFLKCDAEGAEWLIHPHDLEGIRRIEMELHLPPICPPPNPALLDYIGEHYTFSIDRSPVYSPLGVMGILHATRE